MQGRKVKSGDETGRLGGGQIVSILVCLALLEELGLVKIQAE